LKDLPPPPLPQHTYTSIAAVREIELETLPNLKIIPSRGYLV